jgi:vacuolar-type H+-ATPase subunit F/Vma7
MKKITFLTPSDAEFGFNLAGIMQVLVEKDQLEPSLMKVMAEPDTALIVVDERFLGEISEDRIRELERLWQGILLVLPSPLKPPAEQEDYAARLIRRAIGYHVKLNV